MYYGILSQYHYLTLFHRSKTLSLATRTSLNPISRVRLYNFYSRRTSWPTWTPTMRTMPRRTARNLRARPPQPMHQFAICGTRRATTSLEIPMHLGMVQVVFKRWTTKAPRCPLQDANGGARVRGEGGSQDPNPAGKRRTLLQTRLGEDKKLLVKDCSYVWFFPLSLHAVIWTIVYLSSYCLYWYHIPT